MFADSRAKNPYDPTPQAPIMMPAATPSDPYQGMVKSNPIQDALLASANAQTEREQKAQDLLDHMPQLDTSSIGKWLTSAQQIKRSKGMAEGYRDINKRDPLGTASAAQSAETTTGMTNRASLAKELMGNQTSLQVAGMQADASKYGHELTYAASSAANALKIPAAKLDQFKVGVLEKVGAGDLTLDQARDAIAASEGKGAPTYSQSYNQETGQMEVLQTGGMNAGNVFHGGKEAAALSKKVQVLDSTLSTMPNSQLKSHLQELQKTDPEAVNAWIAKHNSK